MSRSALGSLRLACRVIVSCSHATKSGTLLQPSSLRSAASSHGLLRVSAMYSWPLAAPSAAGMRRLSSAASALASRLEGALELLGQLIGTFRPPASVLLPVLRVAGQALTVQGLHLLQHKAAGVPRPLPA